LTHGFRAQDTSTDLLMSPLAATVSAACSLRVGGGAVPMSSAANPVASFQIRNANGARPLFRRRERIVPSTAPESPDSDRGRRARRGRGRPWPSSR
jgi:hypothetical protein